jgi:hypothetical protein
LTGNHFSLEIRVLTKLTSRFRDSICEIVGHCRMGISCLGQFPISVLENVVSASEDSVSAQDLFRKFSKPAARASAFISARWFAAPSGAKSL